MFLQQGKLRQPTLCLVDYKRKLKQSKLNASVTKKSSIRHSSKAVQSSSVHGGYVKRMASLNARARVAAMIEPEKIFIPKSARRVDEAKINSKLHDESVANLAAMQKSEQTNKGNIKNVKKSD